MRTSIAEFLEKEGISLEHTVYREMDERILHFPIISGRFWAWNKKGDTHESFALMQRYLELLETMKQGNAYTCLNQSIEKLKEFITYLKQINKDDTAHRYGRIIQFARMRKRLLEETGTDLEEIFKADAAKKCFGMEKPLSDHVICYKDKLYLTSLHNLSYFIETLHGIKDKNLRETPLFTTSVHDLRKAVKVHKHDAASEQTLGVIGGPCLFGYDEVIMKIIHKSGETYYYDYSGKRNYETDDGIMDKDRIGEHVLHHKEEIAEIGFIDQKKGITKGEYESLLYVFEFARALNAKLLIPIPDMSYRKFLSAICKEIDEHTARQAESAFNRIVRRITNMHLELIEYFKKEYPCIDTEILHEENRALSALFYKEREKYDLNYITNHSITSNRYHRESVIDYITMPALPFYKWGIREIVQIDCISETDSFRKCIKIHKNAFHLHGIFYPERISSDGTYTIYSAKNSRKDYL